jgi:hypothetical protein
LGVATGGVGHLRLRSHRLMLLLQCMSHYVTSWAVVLSTPMSGNGARGHQLRKYCCRTLAQFHDSTAAVATGAATCPAAVRCQWTHASGVAGTGVRPCEPSGDTGSTVLAARPRRRPARPWRQEHRLPGSSKLPWPVKPAALGASHWVVIRWSSENTTRLQTFCSTVRDAPAAVDPITAAQPCYRAQRHHRRSDYSIYLGCLRSAVAAVAERADPVVSGAKHTVVIACVSGLSSPLFVGVLSPRRVQCPSCCSPCSGGVDGRDECFVNVP